MTWWVVLLIAFGSLMIFFCLGMPVAIAFFALDIIGLLVLFGPSGLSIISNSIYESLAVFTLSPIPMFILLGEILFQSGTIRIVFDGIDKVIGGLRARLLIVVIVVSTILGALSGSGMAVAAMLGAAVLPEMNERGYGNRLSIGSILGGATLIPLVPPSIVAVLIGSLANVSISKLLISGILPGILNASLFLAYIIVAVKIKPSLAPIYGKPTSWNEKFFAICKLLPFSLILFLVMGLMMMGIATPAESAATGVIGAIFISACYRRLGFQMMKKALLETLRVSAMIFLIVASAKAFSQILAISGSTNSLVEIVLQIELHPIAVLIIMQLIPFFLGFFLDQFSIMLICIPVYLPVVDSMQFDAIWFWCLFLINMTVGAITPPFGFALYTLKAAAPDTPLHDIYWAAFPFVGIIMIGVVLMVFFPQICTWLPNLLIQ